MVTDVMMKVIEVFFHSIARHIAGITARNVGGR